MKILIICTWFPPDTAVAAVRPFMIAKYLSHMGHEVTVLRSGMFFQRADKEYINRISQKFIVVSAGGIKSPAEKFERKLIDKNDVGGIKSLEVGYQPENRIYRIVLYPLNLFRNSFQYIKRYAQQKIVLQKMIGSFDIVYSTYGELENIFSGQYAAKKFSCRLIQDFRDPLVLPRMRSRLWNFCMKPIEKRAVQKADLCTTVAEAMTQQMKQYGTDTKCITLHNGYERSKYKEDEIPVRKNQFVICYTGAIYPDQRAAAKLLFQAIKDLIDSAKIKKQNMRFIYAGSTGKIWKELLKKMFLDGIYEDHGYLSKDEVERLQRLSDIYLVLSWNYEENQGVISGKFYEGIRAEKPILSVVGGDLPNSELYQMNEKYHYGYCFEEARGKEELEKLKQYLLNAYNQKMKTGKVDYQQNPALEEDFCYENLAKKLESLCYELIGEKQE